MIIVEGEFKAIALCEAGVRAIGVAGLYGFMNEGRLCVRLEKHFAEYPAQRILFLGDNDTELNVNKSTLQQAAAAVSRENDRARTAKEEWKATMELYGTPAFYSQDGKCLTGLNERFWAGLIREQHLLLFEPDEKRFYRYDESTGLWLVQSNASLKQLSCDTVNAELEGDPDYLGTRVLCRYGWTRHGGNPTVYPKPGGRGSQAGPA